MDVKSRMRDPFVIERLPPRELWPALEWLGGAPARYPERLNCAAELLDRAVLDGDGERPAIVHDGTVWSYRRLLEETNRLANLLAGELGVIPGNRVLIRGPNHPWFVAAWLATLKVGAVAIATMPMLRGREIAQILDKAQPDVILCDARVSDEIGEALARAARPPAHILCYAGASRYGQRLEERLAAMPIAFGNADTAGDDPAIIAFTSGTTGGPKGTVHFHRDLLIVCDAYARHVVEASPDDVFCGTPSLAFTYGLGGLLLFPMRVRACTALQERSEDVLRTVEQARGTILFTTPAMYRVLSDLAQRHDISTIRRCISAGETLPRFVYERWLASTGLAILDGIGATEMLHIFISSTAARLRPGATGVAVPGYEARIVDERGLPVAPGTIGRLAVRGPTGARYLDDTDSQRRYVQNGWNLTGDAYWMDSDGFFHYHARVDDLIIADGHNVSPAEVEGVLLTHPAVKECAVVGVPDARRGTQVVKAFIVLRDPALQTQAVTDDIQGHLRRELAGIKCPRHLEFIPALPRTSTGKVQRYQLRRAQMEGAP